MYIVTIEVFGKRFTYICNRFSEAASKALGMAYEKFESLVGGDIKIYARKQSPSCKKDRRIYHL